MMKGKWYTLIGVLVLIGASFLVYQHSDKPECPDDYVNTKDSTAAMEQWTNEYFDIHPNASINDLASARKDFYREHNCTAALQRLADYESGNVDPQTMKAIQEETARVNSSNTP